jgi:hypothetical protein
MSIATLAMCASSFCKCSHVIKCRRNLCCCSCRSRNRNSASDNLDTNARPNTTSLPLVYAVGVVSHTLRSPSIRTPPVSAHFLWAMIATADFCTRCSSVRLMLNILSLLCYSRNNYLSAVNIWLLAIAHCVNFALVITICWRLGL